ncbi:MAG: amino acid ABC transporter substrate-binding protein [Hyphomicrobium sp.]
MAMTFASVLRRLWPLLRWSATALALAGYVSSAQAAASTLERVKERGYLNCGVAETATGLSQVNGAGQWSGIEVEYCAALAAAVFGDKSAVKYRGLAAGDRFKALTDGEVDVLLRDTSWTLTRDAELGGRFVDTLYYDGGGFLAPTSHSIASVLELSGASICVLPGSNGERAVTDFFSARGMRFQLVVSERWEQLVKTYASGGCTVLTGDVSLLAAERSRFPNAAEHAMLPELISKEPIGPFVKRDDDAWFAVVRWSLMALISAEELGLTSANVDDMKTSPLIEVRRLLGLEADLGAPLGLARDWAYQIIKQVGNYADIFDRTLGSRSALKLERGPNQLWAKGGLLYAAPFR